MYILIYMIVGSALTSLWDVLTFKTEHQFNNKERVICILIWPLALGLYLWNLYKTFTKKK